LRTAAAIAGADLVAARTEVERVARIHPGTQRLTGRNATVARSLQVLATVDIAHVAAHGDFRSDNPLLSSLRLHDGSLTVHDLNRLDQVPSVLVLPACESGVSDVGADDELLGLAAALLRMGVIGLVAPVTPIPDESTRPLMVRFHRNLRDTGSPEVALADAVAATQGESPREVATAGSFVLLGA
jgi:CHAT domain-containing protein